jgi:hypothetical protein
MERIEVTKNRLCEEEVWEKCSARAANSIGGVGGWVQGGMGVHTRAV